MLVFGVSYFVDASGLTGRDGIYPQIICVVLVALAVANLWGDRGRLRAAHPDPIVAVDAEPEVDPVDAGSARPVKSDVPRVFGSCASTRGRSSAARSRQS